MSASHEAQRRSDGSDSGERWVYEDMTTEQLRSLIEGTIASHLWEYGEEYENAKVEAKNMLAEYERRVQSVNE